MATKTKSKRGSKVEKISYKNQPLEKNFIIRCSECGKKGLLDRKDHMEREGVLHVFTRKLTGSFFHLREDTERCDYRNEKKAEYCLKLREILEHAIPKKEYQSSLHTSIAKEFYKESKEKDAVLNILKPMREKAEERIKRDQAFFKRIEETFVEAGAKFYEY